MSEYNETTIREIFYAGNLSRSGLLNGDLVSVVGQVKKDIVNLPSLSDEKGLLFPLFEEKSRDSYGTKEREIVKMAENNGQLVRAYGMLVSKRILGYRLNHLLLDGVEWVECDRDDGKEKLGLDDKLGGL
jgi:hypothetical protein